MSTSCRLAALVVTCTYFGDRRIEAQPVAGTAAQAVLQAIQAVVEDPPVDAIRTAS